MVVATSSDGFPVSVVDFLLLNRLVVGIPLSHQHAPATQTDKTFIQLTQATYMLSEAACSQRASVLAEPSTTVCIVNIITTSGQSNLT